MLVIPLMELAVEAAETLGLDPDAFRSFYEEALPKVYGYFLHRCGGSVPVAEDLTQETFLASVSELKKGRRPEARIPWIYGIARHKLLDHYRGLARAERPLDPLLELYEHPPDASVDETRERTVAALDAVPGAQQAALVLHYLDGFSMREIAAFLDKTEKAVEGLLARGRTNFMRAYQETAT